MSITKQEFVKAISMMHDTNVEYRKARESSTVADAIFVRADALKATTSDYISSLMEKFK